MGRGGRFSGDWSARRGDRFGWVGLYGGVDRWIMRRLGFCWLLAVGLLGATPDHSVVVDERFLGSNATEYALLRTETDNQGSYYISRAKTWLDEYSKEDSRREKRRSTLLLDVRRSVDAGHQDPNTPAPVTETVESENATVSFASLLLRYPRRSTEGWGDEKLAKIDAAAVSGISFERRELLAETTMISEVIFGGRPAGEAWKLSGVSDDGNTIFLHLAMGNDQDRATRVMAVPSGESKRTLDQLQLEPIYLVAGTYDQRELAVARAAELRDLAREKKLYGFQPEVWAMLPPTDRITFVVVARGSGEVIKSGNIPSWESALGIHFVPTASDRFQERIWVTR